MARYDNVEDGEARTLLERASSDLRAGDPTSAVHVCCEAFVRLIALKPDLLEANIPDDEKIHHQQFPRLGAYLERGDGGGKMRFDRERFSMSGAITYLDFTTDTALREGL